MELDDGSGFYREDAVEHFPRNGQRVLFVAYGWLHLGFFELMPGMRGGAFYSLVHPDDALVVLPGEPCVVQRWAGANPTGRSRSDPGDEAMALATLGAEPLLGAEVASVASRDRADQDDALGVSTPSCQSRNA